MQRDRQRDADDGKQDPQHVEQHGLIVSRGPEQPGRLVRGQLRARRHGDEPGRDRPEEDEGKVRSVAHAQQHPGARLQPQPEQPGRDSPDDVVDLGEGPPRVVARPVDDDEGVPVGACAAGSPTQ